MKKNYIFPQTIVVKIKSNPLLSSYSNAQADRYAVTLSRESGSRNSDWDDEEE